MDKQEIMKELKESYMVLIDSFSTEIEVDIDPEHIECEFSNDYEDMAYEIGLLRYSISNLINECENEKKEAVEELRKSKMCDCGNVGYFVYQNIMTGDPEQEQCEFCYTRLDSFFNVSRKIFKQ